MIGKTNALAGMKQKQEMVNISLSSNQASHDDLVGAVITLSYGEYTEEIVWNGSEVTRAVPAFVEYTVSFGDVENHKTPDAVTNTSVEGNVRTITGTYLTELVSVTLKADDGSSLSGQTVTINGVEHTFDGNAVEQKVAYGVTYTVSASDKDGYATPEAQTFTAAQSMRNLELTYIASALKVNILSNQENDNTISAVKATVTYGDTTLEVASGQQVGIPTDIDVTITYPEVEGYKTPEAETFRNSNGGVAQKTGTYYTEVVYISTYADEGAPTGFVTTVTGSDGAVLGSFTTDMGIIAIPSGTTYTVSCSDVDGFETPSSKTYTADSITNARREIPMGYKKIKSEALTVNVNADDSSSVDGQNVTVEVPNGVYIQDTDGKLWIEAAWDGSKTPNGIAVVTSECQFVMALEDASSSTCRWGGYGTAVSGIVTTTNSSTAATDYKGDANTTTIINALSGTNDGYVDGAPAAEYCRAYTFPNGQEGYLGAVGEWQAALDNKAAVVSALSKCGGTAMSNYYWTSTQYSSDNSWYMYWNGEYLGYGTKNRLNYYVRAFAPLEIFRETQPVTNGKATFQIPYDTEYTVSVDEKSGYTSPASQTFTASQATRTITMTYEAPKVENLTVNVTSSDGSSVDGQVVTVKPTRENGVYIEDVNGKLWKEEEWDGSATPNGVAVITSNCRFVIALEDAYSSWCIWSDMETLVDGVLATTTKATATTDYAGESNTSKIIAQYGTGNAPAIEYCRNFTFPNGQSGYLGAAGEWQTVISNKDAIKSALTKCGGAILDNIYGTSTQYDADEFWKVYLWDGSSGTIEQDYKNIDFAPRAFTTLKGESQTVSGGKATFTIPVGVTYEVSIQAEYNYITPASQTYTAASGSRTVTMNYIYTTGTLNPSNGVYIQDTYGYCHAAADWTGTFTANGIAVVTDNCRFVVALKDAHSAECYWGGYGTAVSGITTTSSSSTAATDYDGETNTTTIINALSGTNDGYVDGAPAAEYCRAYTFPNGQEGYLGAAGEWQAALDNKAAVVSALSKCGGTAMSSYYWTSTQSSSNSSWCMIWDNENLGNYPKYNDRGYVRAFAAI